MFVPAEKRETTVTLWQKDDLALCTPREAWAGTQGRTSIGWGWKTVSQACLCSLSLPRLTEPNQVKHPAPAARHSGIVLMPRPPPSPLPTQGVLTKEALRDGPERTEVQGLVTPSVPLASLPTGYFFYQGPERENKQAPGSPKAVFVYIKALSQQTAP